jgi:hypothetical protein
MLIYSMGVSVDGFLAQTRELGGYLCGRRLYETMLPWDTDPSMRDNELGAAFADAIRSSSEVARPFCRRSPKTFG